MGREAPQRLAVPFSSRQAARSLSLAEPLYTIDEIAKATKRSRASLYRDIAAKRLVATKINGATRFTRQNFDRYVGANQ